MSEVACADEQVSIAGMDGPERVRAANHPKDPTRGERELTLSSTIFIEATDFRAVDDANFFGLAPGKDVGLLGTTFLLHCTSFDKGKDGAPALLYCKLKDRGDTKPKGNLHWLSESSAVPAEVRLYSALFTVENPNVSSTAAAKPGEAPAPALEGEEGEEEGMEEEGQASWLDLINDKSLLVEDKALVEPSLAKHFASPGTSFQFQRLGFFTVDLDSSPSRPVFNRIVGLKQGAVF
jgi:glutaminyl-tRNA synthetase